MTGQETTDEGGPIGFAPAYGTEDDKSIISPRDALFNPSSISVPGTTINCDDRNPCTRDYRGDDGCHHEAISCDDGDSNTIDTCGPSGCINTPAPALEENRFPQAIRPSILLDTQIINETDAVDGKSDIKCGECDDGNACTADSCDPATGCSHAAMDCNDNDACTSDTCDPATGCSHAAVDCNDNDACTTDSCDHVTGCVNEPVACDDGNDSTKDSCQGGVCIYQPIIGDDDISEILSQIHIDENLSNSSQNNSTSHSADISAKIHHPKCHNNDPCMELVDSKNCTYQLKNCSDGDPSTNDYCYNGICYHTATVCDDGNNCTVDSFNGTECIFIQRRCNDRNPCTDDSCDPATGACVHANNNAICNDRNACTTGDTCSGGSCKGTAVHCDDHNPCTYNRCDSKIGCYYPKKCKEGQICVDGTCKYPYYYYYPYYPYYPYGVPYAPPAPTAPAPAPSKPQSYTIPAGTSITLPWGGSMLSAEVLQVYNGQAYPGATPISFTRDLGSPAQIASVGQVALSAMNQWEMIGLSWKDASFKMTLVQPNKIVLPAQGDGRNVVHLTGSNYDYYFLRSPPAGNWTVQIMPVNAAPSGTGYSLISGLVQGAIPPNQA